MRKVLPEVRCLREIRYVFTHDTVWNGGVEAHALLSREKKETYWVRKEA